MGASFDLIMELITTQLGYAIPPASGHSVEHAITVHLPSWAILDDFIQKSPALFARFKSMVGDLVEIQSVWLDAEFK